MPLREALARERAGSTPVEAVSDEPAPRAQVPRAKVPRIQVPARIRRRGFSLLRASIGNRLGLVAAALVLLWASVYWALQ